MLGDKVSVDTGDQEVGQGREGHDDRLRPEGNTRNMCGERLGKAGVVPSEGAVVALDGEASHGLRAWDGRQSTQIRADRGGLGGGQLAFG